MALGFHRNLENDNNTLLAYGHLLKKVRKSSQA